jgi:hypothetical protein
VTIKHVKLITSCSIQFSFLVVITRGDRPLASEHSRIGRISGELL